MKRSPRKSLVLDKLRNGEFVYSMKFNLESSRAIEIAALNGFDCAWVCDEHIANDAALLERQILAAKAYDIDLLVRVQRGSYSDLIKPLELDAAGIMVPHTMSGADAGEIVRNTKFYPLGRRPLDGGNADGMFGLFPGDYFEFVNTNRFVLVQIEDKEAMDELDKICSVPGIDIIFFGPGDFSQSIGETGNITSEVVVEARRKVAEAARRHGKFAGTVAAGATVAELHEEGYQFLNLGADVIALGSYCREQQKKIAALPKFFTLK